jgi:hypothetical protein
MKKLFLVLLVLSVVLFGFFAGFVMKVQPENKVISVDVPIGETLKTQNAPKPVLPVAQPTAQPVLAPLGDAKTPLAAPNE